MKVNAVLVVGGSGFIGRHLVARLVAAHGPAAVTCLVEPPTRRDYPIRIKLRSLGVKLIDGDLCNPAVSRVAAPRVDAVLHLAANIETGADESDLRVNDVGTRHLLNWLAPVSAGIRFVYTSSVAVLDRDGPARGALSETSPCHPRTAYGRTKLRAEEILTASAAIGGYSFTIVRLGTVFGPGAKYGGLFESLIRLTAQGALRVRINWPGRVSVMHVDDVVRLLEALAVDPRAANQVFCAANPDAPTVGELAARIGELRGRPVRIVRVPNWVWASVRRIAWHPLVQFTGAAIAPQLFWRFTLIIDHGFWLDTTKLQSLWRRSPSHSTMGSSR